jgi:hypothetical protein
VEAYTFVIFKGALVEVAISKPKEAEPILFIIFKAAFVNDSIIEPQLSDSVFFALLPIASVYSAIREYIDPLAMKKAMIEVPFVKVLIRKCIYTPLAMRLIFD